MLHLAEAYVRDSCQSAILQQQRTSEVGLQFVGISRQSEWRQRKDPGRSDRLFQVVGIDVDTEPGIRPVQAELDGCFSRAIRAGNHTQSRLLTHDFARFVRTVTFFLGGSCLRTTVPAGPVCTNVLFTASTSVRPDSRALRDASANA